MKINEDLLNKFKVDFKNDYGFDLNGDEAKETLVRLVNFFDLLWRFDQEDKEKAMEMKGLKNGSGIL